MATFLERFGSGEFAGECELVWMAWVDAIALLGLRHFEPMVLQATEQGLVDEFVFERDEFYAMLEHAERTPSDVSRFTGVGYLDDVVEALNLFSAADEDEIDDGAAWPDDEDEGPTQPVINPWRHVGRNDPCPCGSGKKAKRCCLAD
jgi:hypothetical protein